MKKALIIIGIIAALLLVAAISLPLIFKDEIQAKVRDEINASVNTDVYFRDFGLSLFRNFPHATASLYDFGVVNKAPFEGDTLISANSLRIAINLFSLLSDKIRIDKIEMNDPKALIMVLEDGTANYDIILEEEETSEEDTSTFAVAIDNWTIRNGQVVYFDLSTNVLIRLDGVYHEGSGDITQDEFDMNTFTRANSISVSYEDVEYISNKKLEADVIMNMNMSDFRFTFLDNKVKLNDFAFGFEGWLEMPEENIDMDIAFAAKENTFKSLLSLVPGMYTDEFKNIEAEGTLAFNGSVKGTYSDEPESMPAISLALQVNDGTVRYPELPKPVSDINIDLSVDVPGGITENTRIDLKKFHIDFGGNPIDARLLVEGLESMKVNADITAKANLADLNQMIPMEGLNLKGMLTANLKADGIYDSLKSLFPKMEAAIALRNGYVKTAEFPSAIDNLNFEARITNPNGQMSQTEIWVNNFEMALDGEPFMANLYLKDIENYTWDLAMKGNLDLEKAARIMELKDMELKGIISADIKSKGQMADVEAGRYDRLPASGSMSVNSFYFKSADFPQGFAIVDAQATFDPGRIILDKFEGSAGSSDLSLNGYLSNYIGFLFKENEMLKGEMNLRSNKFNVNEWMTDDGSTEEDTLELEVVEIPSNIDFIFNSNIKQVLYDNLVLNDVLGKVSVRNSRVTLENLKFRMLNGLFSMSGYYSTEDPANPMFDFKFNVDGLAVQDAFQNFNTVQALAPVARNVEGKFSANFSLNGGLQQNMMPYLPSLSGKGIIELASAALKDSKLVSGITSFASKGSVDEVSLNDVKIDAEIKEGRLHVKPFDFMLGNIQSSVQGSNGIDGSLDYTVTMTVPTGQLGQALNEAIASKFGATGAIAEKIAVPVRLTGTYNDPKFGLGQAEKAATATSSPASQAREAIAERIEEEKQAAEEDIKGQIEEKKEEAREIVEEEKKKAEEEVKKEVEKAKNRLKDLFK